ncbi:MAG TPA: helix-turn-helix domain-containing protein [Rhizomicrobium sp.]
MTDERPLDFDEWLSTVRTVCGPMDAEHAGEDNFKGYVTSRRVADVRMLRHHADVSSLHWNDRHIQEIQSPYLYVILQTSPELLAVRQSGAEVLLRKGDWTLIDSLKPAEFEFADRLDIVAFNLPRELMAKRAWNSDLPLPRVFSGSHGSSALFSAYAAALYVQADALNPDDTRHRETFLDLLFASLPDDFDAQSRARDRRLQRALKYVDDHLSDSSLSPAMIAAEIGVSLRHLHRLFEDMGRSVGDVIRQRRLERARCDLSDPRFSGTSVLDIALNWGFSDAAHFSRAFRSAFGKPPRDYRTIAPHRG